MKRKPQQKPKVRAKKAKKKATAAEGTLPTAPDSSAWSRLMKKIRKLIAKVRHSYAVTGFFETAIKETGLDKETRIRKLILDSRIRWNSTAEMFKRFLILRAAIDVLCRGGAPSKYKLEQLKLLKRDWEMAEELFDVFRIFTTATIRLSSSTTTMISSVYPYYHRLLEKLENFAQTKGLENPVGFACNEGWNHLDDYYRFSDSHSHFSIATALDPRFGLSVFEKMSWRDEHIKEVESDLYKIYDRYKTTNVHSASESPQLSDHAGLPKKRKRLMYDLEEDDDLTLLSSTPLPGASTENEHEIERYRKVSYTGSDPLGWWKGTGRFQFPVLAQMARDYLAIQATSVPSEQVRSTTPFILGV
jgi:hypothetical protein